MTLPAVLAAVGGLAVAPVEHLLRGLYGDGASGAITVGALAVLAFTGAAWRRERETTAGSSAVAVWIAAGLLAASVSGAIGGLPVLSRMLLAGAWFLFGARASSARGLGMGLIIGGSVATVFAVWQVSGGLNVPDTALATLDRLDPALAERMRARLAQPRGFAFFLYPNVLGGFLILGLPFAAAWRATGGGFAAAAALAVLAAGLVVSGSIGATASMVLAAIAVTEWRGRGRRGAVAVLAAAVVLAAILILRPTASASGGLAGRVALWAAAVHPGDLMQALIGGGPGQFGVLVRDRVPSPAWSSHAHNWFAETFAELGVTGLIALLWALRAPLGGAITSLRDRDPWRRAAVAAWIAGGLHALLDIDYVVPVLIAPWWFLAGRLVAGGPPAVHRRSGIRTVVPGWAALAGGVILVALLRGPLAGAAAGALSGGALAWWWYRRITAGDRFPGSLRMDGPWVVLMMVAATWAICSPSMDRSLVTGLEAVGLFGLMLAARAILGHAQDEPRFRSAVITAGCVLAMWAAAEALIGGTRGRGPFPSPNTLASWLAFAVALAAGSLRPGRIGLAAGVVLAAGLLASGSTGGMVAAVVAAACAMAARTGARRSRAIRTAMWVVPVTILGTALVLRNDSSGFHRLTMWREAATLLSSNPGGCGPGRYADAVSSIRLPSETSAGVGRYSLVAEFAHCEPLQFAAEWGMIPLGLLVWGIVMAWRGSDPRRRCWWWGLVALGVHGLVDFPFRAPPVAVLAAVALGAATSRKGSVAGSSRRIAWLPMLIAVWCALAFIRPAASRLALAAGRADVAAVCWPPSADASGAAGHEIAERAFALTGPTPLLVRSEELLRRADALGGGRWTDLLELGRFLHERGFRTGSGDDLDAAGETLARASAAAPWSTEVLIARAELAAARKRWREADGFLDEAAKREPFCLAVAADRAEFLRRRGKLDDARRTLSAAIILQAHALQRPGLNEYEMRLLSTPDPQELRHRLIGLGGTR